MKDFTKFIIAVAVLSILVTLAGTAVSAADNTYKFNEQIDYSTPCLNNGTYCSGTSMCNLTVIDQSSKVIINNKQMNNQIAFHNYTIPPQTNLGEYSTTVMCCDGGVCGSESFTFDVTADGVPYNNLPVQMIILFIGYAIIMISFLFNRAGLFNYVGSAIVIIMGTITLYPGYAYINHTTLVGTTLGFTSIGLGFFFLFKDTLFGGDN